jgi:hypothetical protein
MTSHAASATAAFPIPQATASTTAQNSATSNSTSNHVAVRRGVFLERQLQELQEAVDRRAADVDPERGEFVPQV